MQTAGRYQDLSRYYMVTILCFFNTHITVFVQAFGNPNNFSVLSDREKEVLQLIAEGKGSKEISSRFYISVNTIIRHRQYIMDKLELHNVAELTRYAIREGFIQI